MMLLMVMPALASGYYFLDSGTRSIGRGGAFIAGADDQSAQYYNPAALSNVTRTMINLNVWGVNQYVKFDRADETGIEPFAPVENSSAPIIEPQIGVVIPLYGVAPWLKYTTIAIGMWVPSAPYLTFPSDGAQRFSVTDELVWQVYAGPSVAQKLPFAPWITLGGSLEYTFLRVDEDLVAVMCGTDCPTESGEPEDASNDIALELRAWDPMKWSGNFGVLIEPTPWLKIGASAQPPISYEAPGTLKSTVNEDNGIVQLLESNVAEDADITLLLTVPWIVRGGVEVHPIEPLKVELAGSWIGWSLMDEQRVTDVNLELHGKEGTLLDGVVVPITDDIVLKTGFQDAWSARLGGDWTFSDAVKIRAGGFYESSSLPDAWLGQSVIDRAKWGGGAGATFTIAKRVALDVGISESILSSTPITDSELRQQGLTVSLSDYSTSVVAGKVIGNGDFQSNVTFVGVGASVYLGPDPGSAASN